MPTPADVEQRLAAYHELFVLFSKLERQEISGASADGLAQFAARQMAVGKPA